MDEVKSHPPQPEELERFRRGLFLYACRQLGDADSAEDIAQETLSRVLAVLRNGATRPINLPAFIIGVARHVIADERRRNTRERPLDPATEPTLLLDRGGRTHRDPLQETIDSEIVETIRRALNRLPDEDRALLEACFYEGLTSAELARRLQVAPERIRKRKSRALERLRRLLQRAP